MQAAWEALDWTLRDPSDFDVLSPGSSDEQPVGHCVWAESRDDLSHAPYGVEEERMSAHASAGGEHGRRDSDQLDILGEFDFGTFPQSTGQPSMPVATDDFQWHTTESYLDSTSLSQSDQDDTWSHFSATAANNGASIPNSWDQPAFKVGARTEMVAMPSSTRREPREMLPIRHNSIGAEALRYPMTHLILNDLTPPQDLTCYSGHQFAPPNTNGTRAELNELSPPYTQYDDDESFYHEGASAANSLHDHDYQRFQRTEQQSALFQPDPSFLQPTSPYDAAEVARFDVHESSPANNDTFVGFQVALGHETQQRAQAIPIKKGSRSNIYRQQKRRSDTVNSKIAFPAARGPPSLETVEEDGRGNVIYRGGLSKRGVRVGPLPKEQALRVAKTRKEQTVCMKCRADRCQCTGGLPCQRCQKLLVSGMLEQPCLKAQFLDIVEAGSCNYISQRAINHLTLDNTRRIQMFLPETFKLGELLTLLETRQSRYRIKARQQSGPLYTLDLAKCHRFLTAVCAKQGREEFDLRNFIDNKLLGTSEWLDSVSEYRNENGIVALLAQWGNMPSRASYAIQPIDGSPERDLDVEDAEDRAEILIAAQLSRIICRKLEVDGYKALQSAINKLRFKTPSEVHKFVHELGQLLVTLRWRVSWWELLGDGSNRDLFRDRFVERVRELSKVLYFYFFTVKRRLGSWNDARGELEGMMSFYADATPVFDDFPVTESIDGFQTWMEQGKVLLFQAGVVQKLAHRQSTQI